MLSAVFLNLASTMRYDAVLFVPILSILLLVYQNDKIEHQFTVKNLKWVILFACLSLVFTITWLVGDFYFSKEPRPKGGALKSKQLQLTFISIPMISNVSPNYLRGYFIPNCPGKIDITPKLSSPQNLLQPRKLSEYPA